MAVSNDKDKAVSELIYRSGFFMDDMKFSEYLDLCAKDFTYKITAYSPELRKDMVWQDVDKEEMKKHLDLIPKHVRDNATLSRHLNVCTISYSDDGRQASAVSGLQVFKTKRDGGETKLFGIGRVIDVIALEQDPPQLLSREVRLDTRQLGIGSQIPF
jgi:methanesulfonate monooxygenase small subunit